MKVDCSLASLFSFMIGAMLVMAATPTDTTNKALEAQVKQLIQDKEGLLTRLDAKQKQAEAAFEVAKEAYENEKKRLSALCKQ